MRRMVVIAPLMFGAGALLAAVNAVYIVDQGRQAVLLRLGQPAAVVNGGRAPMAAGLHLKWPFVDEVTTLDRRTLEIVTAPAEFARPAAPTTLQADMRYRIRDPLRFYRALGDERLGEQKLSQRLQDSFDHALAGVGARDPASARDAVDTAMLADLRGQASGLGIDVLDVGLASAAPSPSAIEDLSRRMQDAETQRAAQIRVEGDQHKHDLVAQADRDAADIRSEGERQALEVRGDGDAQRAAILGAAYGQDPAFARFFRRLEAYDQAFNPENTTLVLSPDNAFLDLFEHGPGAKPGR